MSLINTLWNAAQELQVHSIRTDVTSLKHEAAQAARDEAALTQQVYVQQLTRLALVCQAMWTLVQEKTGLQEKDLLERVTELDLRDGTLDGRYTKPPIDCLKCGSKVARKFNRCLFCGEPSPAAAAFDAI